MLTGTSKFNLSRYQPILINLVLSLTRINPAMAGIDLAITRYTGL